MRVLLTGAAGFLGHHLIDDLASAHEVFAVARSKGPAGGAERVQWVDLDLAEPLAARRLPQRIDAVIHLAQSRHYREFPGGAPDVFAINVRATAELLHYAQAAGARTFVLASSGSVYAPQQDPIVESTPAQPADFYSTSKHLAEQLVDAYSGCFSTVALRYFFLYGHGQRERLIPNLAAQLRAGRPVTLSGPTGLRFNPIHVDDAARVTLAALELDGHHSINVAGSEVLTLREVATDLATALTTEPRFVLENRPLADRVADITTMRELLGVTPRVTWKAGLADLLPELLDLLDRE